MGKIIIALKDLSVVSLIIANIFTLYIAIYQGWSLYVLMLVYVSQSVIMGLFNFIRILSLKEFDTDGFKIGNKQPAANSSFTKYYTAFFFLFHYGLFHLAYFVFTFGFIKTEAVKVDYKYVIITIVIFFINHAFSYFYNINDKKKYNIGQLMFYLYPRIVPMHLIIIFGTVIGFLGLPVFVFLKTGADVVMHFVEHGIFGQKKIEINQTNI